MAITITIKKINSLMPETIETWTVYFRSLLSNVVIISGPAIAFFWGLFNWANKRTEAQLKRDRDFIRTVFLELIQTPLSEIQRDIQEMKKETHRSLNEIKDEVKKVDDRVDDVYKNLK